MSNITLSAVDGDVGRRTFRYSFRRVFERLEELCRIYSYRLANGQKLHDVDAAFTALIFGHKRLRLVKAISQLALSQTCGFALSSGHRLVGAFASPSEQSGSSAKRTTT
jgi:hypothetical protein